MPCTGYHYGLRPLGNSESHCMQLVRHVPHSAARPLVLGIGNFDGWHRGHQALAALVRERAAALNCASGLLCFEPQPRELLSPASAPARLSPLADKLRFWAQAGIDVAAALRFNRAFAAMSPLQFAERVLADGLRAVEVVVGADFRYGRARLGDLQSLRSDGEALGFRVRVADCISDRELRISSTAVRAALAEGDCARAEHLLGRPYSITGRVGHGKKLGRTLGYPTANLAIGRRRSPVHGIYAVWVHGAADRPWPAVASVGTRPTVGGEHWLAEAHLFDFNADLYGCRLRLDFVAFLRAEQSFDGLDPLVDQMHEDARRARAVLAADDVDSRRIVWTTKTP